MTLDNHQNATDGGNPMKNDGENSTNEKNGKSFPFVFFFSCLTVLFSS
jgi:hypothetical protein